jgi:hypothetical protein
MDLFADHQFSLATGASATAHQLHIRSAITPFASNANNIKEPTISCPLSIAKMKGRKWFRKSIRRNEARNSQAIFLATRKHLCTRAIIQIDASGLIAERYLESRRPEQCFQSNQPGSAELSTMPKSSITGPMNTQPGRNTSTIPTPMRPAIGTSKKNVRPKERSTRMEAVRLERAKLSRRNSLRIQREALKR